MFKVGDKVKMTDTELEAEGELLSEETINVLKNVEFTGEVTQVQDGLFYVGFLDGAENWVTQVFKEDEIKEAK